MDRVPVDLLRKSDVNEYALLMSYCFTSNDKLADIMTETSTLLVEPTDSSDQSEASKTAAARAKFNHSRSTRAECDTHTHHRKSIH